MPMTQKAIAQFLKEDRIGVLGINREGSPPQQVPVWFLFEDGVIWMMSEKRVPKIENLKKDPRVSLCVDESTFPYQAVVAYGTLTLSEEDVKERRSAIASMYLGTVKGEAYANEPRPKGVILLRLEPDHFYSFDDGRARQAASWRSGAAAGR